MDATEKRKLSRFLFLGVVLAAGFGSTFRLLSDDPVRPGLGGLILFSSALTCIGILGISSSLTGRARVRVLPLILLTAFSLVCGVLTCAIESPSPFLGAAYFIPLAGNLLFFLMVLHAGEDREFGKFALKGALAVVLIQCALGIYQFYSAAAARGDGVFRGTYASSSSIAGILAMMFPVAAGLLVNSIHERLDRSVWPRRVLYSISLILLAGGLYYAGSEIAWIALALGMAVALVMTGKTYLSRNRRAVCVTAGVVTLLAVGATALQTQSTFHIPGYGALPERLETAFHFAREDVETASRFPLLGSGFERSGWTPPVLNAGVPPSEGPAVFRLAAEGGLPAAGSILLLLFAAFALCWKGMKCPPMDQLEPRVVVGRRRVLKAINLYSVGVLGGCIGFYAFQPYLSGFSHTAFLLVFLPIWLLVLTTSFSYKHFQLIVENRRDFVAIGAASGAVVGILSSFVEGDLLHPPSQFLLLLLLAVALSRNLDSDRIRVLDFRSPKFLRPLFGVLSGILCLGAVALGVAAWAPEGKKGALALREAPSCDPIALGREKGAGRKALLDRIRAYERLAKTYRFDPKLWTKMGTSSLRFLAAELHRWDSGGPIKDRIYIEDWVRVRSAPARDSFRKAMRISRSHHVPGEEGWAWLAIASGFRPPSLIFLRKARDVFLEAIDLAPEVPSHWAGLGESYLLMEEKRRAFEAFSKALRLSREGGPRRRLSQELERRVRARQAATGG